MSQMPLLAGATKGSITAATPLLIVVALVAGFVVEAAALLWSAAGAAEARSRKDRGGRLRALDELAAVGSLLPDEYAKLQTTLLHER